MLAALLATTLERRRPGDSGQSCSNLIGEDLILISCRPAKFEAIHLLSAHSTNQGRRICKDSKTVPSNRNIYELKMRLGAIPYDVCRGLATIQKAAVQKFHDP